MNTMELEETIDAMVKEKLDRIAGKPVNKMAGMHGAAGSGKADHSDMRSLMRALHQGRPDVAAGISRNHERGFTGSSHLIPENTMQSIFTLMDEYGIARRYCTITPVSTEKTTLPKLLEGLNMSWLGSTAHKGTDPYYYASGTRKPVTKPEFGSVDIHVRELAGIFACKQATLDDTNTNFEEILPRLFAQAISLQEDSALFNGVDYPDGTKVGGLFDVATTVPGTISVNSLLDMQDNLSPAALNGAAYYMSQSTLNAFTKTLLSDNIQNAGAKRLSELVNLPIRIANVLPSSNDVTDDFLLLGNLQNSYIADRKQMSIDIATQANIYDADGDLMHQLWQDNMIGWRCFERLDIQSAADEAFATLDIYGG